MLRLRFPDLTPLRQRALLHLVEALQAARELRQSPVAFACERSDLHDAGVTDAILRWLCTKGLVEHRVETTKPRQRRRTFRRATNLHFGESSCFVLTDDGCALAQRCAIRARLRPPTAQQAASNHRPSYDSARRMLLCDGQVVKQFKMRAQNQELILLAFEEERWPSQLADPLPGKNGMDAKRRLNETIRSLNSNHHKPVLRFRGDGTGKGIVWEKLR
jgi:hypothetical protein